MVLNVEYDEVVGARHNSSPNGFERLLRPLSSGVELVGADPASCREDGSNVVMGSSGPRTWIDDRPSAPIRLLLGEDNSSVSFPAPHWAGANLLLKLLPGDR